MSFGLHFESWHREQDEKRRAERKAREEMEYRQRAARFLPPEKKTSSSRSRSRSRERRHPGGNSAAPTATYGLLSGHSGNLGIGGMGHHSPSSPEATRGAGIRLSRHFDIPPPPKVPVVCGKKKEATTTGSNGNHNNTDGSASPGQRKGHMPNAQPEDSRKKSSSNSSKEEKEEGAVPNCAECCQEVPVCECNQDGEKKPELRRVRSISRSPSPPVVSRRKKQSGSGSEAASPTRSFANSQNASSHNLLDSTAEQTADPKKVAEAVHEEELHQQQHHDPLSLMHPVILRDLLRKKSPSRPRYTANEGAAAGGGGRLVAEFRGRQSSSRSPSHRKTTAATQEEPNTHQQHHRISHHHYHHQVLVPPPEPVDGAVLFQAMLRAYSKTNSRRRSPSPSNQARIGGGGSVGTQAASTERKTGGGGGGALNGSGKPFPYFYCPKETAVERERRLREEARFATQQKKEFTNMLSRLHHQEVPLTVSDEEDAAAQQKNQLEALEGKEWSKRFDIKYEDEPKARQKLLHQFKTGMLKKRSQKIWQKPLPKPSTLEEQRAKLTEKHYYYLPDIKKKLDKERKERKERGDDEPDYNLASSYPNAEKPELNDDDKRDYVAKLGIPLRTVYTPNQKRLSDFAAELLCRPFPKFWMLGTQETELAESGKRHYFYNYKTKESFWHHPLIEEHKKLVAEEEIRIAMVHGADHWVPTETDVCYYATQLGVSNAELRANDGLFYQLVLECILDSFPEGISRNLHIDNTVTPNIKQVYWYNHAQRTSSWTHPYMATHKEIVEEARIYGGPPHTVAAD